MGSGKWLEWRITMINSLGSKVNCFLRMLVILSVTCATVLTGLLAVDFAEAKTTPVSSDTSYVRYATGINIYGAPKDWYGLAVHYGYYVSDQPVPGGVVSFEKGAYGTNSTYGFVGVVVYYREVGNYWDFGARYSYPATERTIYYNHAFAKEQSFRVLKKDPNVHYIYRHGENKRPDGYYFRPEYVGYEVLGTRQPLAAEKREVTVYSENVFAKAFVGSGQVVRILAKAEVGETIWVFIKTSHQPKITYAKTYYYGKEELSRFDPYSGQAYKMYYAKDYGDSVLDLGYGDYSNIAGKGGEITVTLKKGNDPRRLVPLQTIRLRLGRE